MLVLARDRACGPRLFVQHAMAAKIDQGDACTADCAGNRDKQQYLW